MAKKAAEASQAGENPVAILSGSIATLPDQGNGSVALFPVDSGLAIIDFFHILLH